MERAGGGALLTLGAAVAPARSGRTSLTELWKPAYARRTAMLWILWFGITFTYYGIFLYVPSLLAARGLSEVRSNEFFFLSTIAQIPGYFSAAWLVERWGRKPTLVAYLLGTAAAAFLFGNSGTGTDAFLYAALLSFFNLGAWGVVYTISPELYPTAVRGTGAGVAAAVGRIGGIIGPFLTPVLVPALGRVSGAGRRVPCSPGLREGMILLDEGREGLWCSGSTTCQSRSSFPGLTLTRHRYRKRH